MKRIREFLIILLASFVGEALHFFLPFPVPAGIYGMAVLFLGLCCGVVKLHQTERAADFLVEIMPLFFIPAGVGLMTKWGELQSMIVPVILAVSVITALVMAVTGRVAQWFLRRGERKEKEGGQDE